ncbi:MAG TPA: hypothetical protein V6D22_11305 [Candidatus Obscuribacterales bacterium]
MSFISPALIARIYHALGQNRGSDAVLLLRQHSLCSNCCPDAQLMSEVVKLANENMNSGDLDRAEEHYELALALYESCFPTMHAEALRAVAGLISLSEQANDVCRVRDLIQEAETVTHCLRDQYTKPRAIAV